MKKWMEPFREFYAILYCCSIERCFLDLMLFLICSAFRWNGIGGIARNFETNRIVIRDDDGNMGVLTENWIAIKQCSFRKMVCDDQWSAGGGGAIHIYLMRSSPHENVITECSFSEISSGLSHKGGACYLRIPELRMTSITSSDCRGSCGSFIFATGFLKPIEINYVSLTSCISTNLQQSNSSGAIFVDFESRMSCNNTNFTQCSSKSGPSNLFFSGQTISERLIMTSAKSPSGIEFSSDGLVQFHQIIALKNDHHEIGLIFASRSSQIDISDSIFKDNKGPPFVGQFFNAIRCNFDADHLQKNTISIVTISGVNTTIPNDGVFVPLPLVIGISIGGILLIGVVIYLVICIKKRRVKHPEDWPERPEPVDHIARLRRDDSAEFSFAQRVKGHW
jgi:hypothetical protein